MTKTGNRLKKGQNRKEGKIDMTKTAAIILAAGEGTRMSSDIPKVLHAVCGKSMIRHVIDAMNSAGINDIIVVVGHKSELVEQELKGIRCVKQEKLLGTADAVLKAKDIILKDPDITSVLISYGDVPLLTPDTLKRIVEVRISAESGCALLTSILKNPTGYGRIIRDNNEKIVKIIEETEASIYEKVIEEINVGVYCFKTDILFDVLADIRPDNKKKEYYLTDAVDIMAKKGIKINSVTTEDLEEFQGVNTRQDLAKAEKVMLGRILDSFMREGVTIRDPANTYIEKGAEIGKDTIIYPYTFIEKDVKIGRKCAIGPFARLRHGALIEDEAEIGNFAEIVRSRIGKRSKVKHQCYIGDTSIGENVNIGAGTIVANYDGKDKHKTVIEDNAFIGTGSILIAPVKIGKGAVTGAGSVVTKNKDVPPGTVVTGIPAKILKK
jgi:bifunctional UDP-N-acetylglucosamine pyrophosphorylase / glucosamine-1-phosphate N-acetyltransferase